VEILSGIIAFDYLVIIVAVVIIGIRRIVQLPDFVIVNNDRLDQGTSLSSSSRRVVFDRSVRFRFD
jgi:hypothetical protein